MCLSLPLLVDTVIFCLVGDVNRLNQQLTESMDVSVCGMDSGRKLLQISLECVESMPVDYFSVLDYTGRGVAGRLNPTAGICGSDRRSDAVVLTDIPCSAGRKNAE